MIAILERYTYDSKSIIDAFSKARENIFISISINDRASLTNSDLSKRAPLKKIDPLPFIKASAATAFVTTGWPRNLNTYQGN
jgi:hypothetical protein